MEMFRAVDLRLEAIELTAHSRGWSATGRAALAGWDEDVCWEAWRGPADPAWSVVLAPDQHIDWGIAELFLEDVGLIEAVNRELDRRVAA